jgi:hypothetical protein
MNKQHVGKILNNGAETVEIKQYPKNMFYFQGYEPQFTIYVDTKKTLKNLKIVEKQIDMSFKSTFCPRCGERLLDETANT